MTLLRVELRRALRRRLVRVLVLLALTAIVMFGVIVFVMTTHFDVAASRIDDGEHAAVLTDWWVPGRADGLILVAAGLLLVCAVLGGASMVGAEWRAGTVASLLTWEPRRARVYAARLAASMLVAFVVAVVLQALFVLAALPAMVAHGTTEDADAAWWTSFLLVILRVGLVTALAAAVGGALAWIGRNTAAALAGVFGWMIVGENLVRALRPGLGKYLIGPTIGTVVPWAHLHDSDLSRSPWPALLGLLGIVAAVVAAGMLSFAQRDVVTG